MFGINRTHLDKKQQAVKVNLMGAAITLSLISVEIELTGFIMEIDSWIPTISILMNSYPVFTVGFQPLG